MQYKLLWKHSPVPIKWSAVRTSDPLACHDFNPETDDKLWCGRWFLLLELAFYLLASDFFPHLCDSGTGNTFLTAIFFLKYIFTIPLNYIGLTIDLGPQRFLPLDTAQQTFRDCMGECKVLSNRNCHGCLVLILEGIVFCFLHTTSRAIPAISCRMQRKLYDTARVSIIVFFKPCVNTQFLLQGFLTPFPCEAFHLWPTENITL